MGDETKPTADTHGLPSEATRDDRVPDAGEPSFVVGVGASAGGFEAFGHLLEAMPPDTGMAFVIVQHLAPNHESRLDELVARFTPMPVLEVEDGMRLTPNTVFIIPPNTSLEVSGGTLVLSPRPEGPGRHMVIDIFFRSLASAFRTRAIGVVLSGTGSDGALGVHDVKAEDGMTFAQDPESAKFDAMPRNAIATGDVDYVLEPAELARELARISRHSHGATPLPVSDAASGATDGDFARILAALRSATKIDFTSYRTTTLERRVRRRMGLNRCTNLGEYARFLEEHPTETALLADDVLINVTRFFRDPEAFEALTRIGFPRLLEARSSGPIRIWVPACATGEEVYSIAISLLEFLGERASRYAIQLFGTDISSRAIEKARSGTYIENIALDVSEERLRRFFTQHESTYEVTKAVRELCVFATQNITTDPPFSRIDLISCRNVLIYFERSLQDRILPLFHYALNPSGLLMLGTSETVGSFADMFTVVDKKQKLFAKHPSDRHVRIELSPPRQDPATAGPSRASTEGRPGTEADLVRDVDRIALARYCPPAVVIDEHFAIVQFRGQTGRFLEPTHGEASLSLLTMLRPDLVPDLRLAVQEAARTSLPVRTRRLRSTGRDAQEDVYVEVIPVRNRAREDRLYIVSFESAPARDVPEGSVGPAPEGEADASRAVSDEEIAELKDRLVATREHLQSIIEEREATNEELQAANEEALSSNEELQSVNEELQTTKEEMESANEELQTLNEELGNRNLELDRLNNDLANLLASVHIPIIMVGNDLRIRRFTPTAEKLLNLIPTDIGRPVGDIRPNVDIPDLEPLLLDVIENVRIHEREVRDRSGHWYVMRIRPYRTRDNRIEGAVIGLVDVDELKRSLEESQAARAYADAIVETVREPLVVFDAELRVQRANAAFYQTFKTSAEATEGRPLQEAAGGALDVPELRRLLEE